ncbi:MAG: outer membrane lipid asymmetry maintenance protein MlaD [Acidiferrobacteraceae bacterium]
MAKNNKTLEFVVGLFVIAGIAALAILALRVSNLHSFEQGPGYDVKAYFNDIGGLKTNAPVTMAGVRIGRVARIYFDKKRYQAVAVLRIESRYNTIPTDTSASILTQGLLGEQYVGLNPGGAPQYLKNGDKITMTQSAMVLEQIIGQFLFHKAGEGEQQQSQSAPAPGIPSAPPAH